jgi:2',3'-cyclic-nucleotide 2'-phosphodiesterase (5'-nucleotidase family)
LRRYNFTYLVLISATLLWSCGKNNQQDYSSSIISSSTEISEKNGIDSDLVNLIKPYKDILEDSMNMVIGTAQENILKSFPKNPLGNLVCDIMLDFTKRKSENKVDFALSNNGGLRVPINKGEITVGDIYELMPFENELVILELTDTSMQHLFDYIANGDGTAVSSGVELIYKDNSIDKAVIGKIPYSPKQSYYLLTTDYLANGGSGMWFLENIPEKIYVGAKLREVILEEIIYRTNSGENISPVNEQRIFIDE